MKKLETSMVPQASEFKVEINGQKVVKFATYDGAWACLCKTARMPTARRILIVADGEIIHSIGRNPA